MRWTVVWMPDARNELIKLWTRARDRRTITRIVNQLDQNLARFPEAMGESRDENRRIYHSPPLGVTFSVSHDDRVVAVLDIWRTDRA